MEKNVLLIPTDGRKAIVLTWTEIMSKFNLTSEQVKEAINNSDLIKDKFYLDEALTY